MPAPDILRRPWVYFRGDVYLDQPRNGEGHPTERIALGCPDSRGISNDDKARALRACAAVPDFVRAARLAIPVLRHSCATTDAEDISDRLALDAMIAALEKAGAPE